MAMHLVNRLKRLWPTYWPSNARYHKPVPRPRVVYLIAMPRTGSTVAKRYLGEHEGLLVAPNQSFRHAWKLARQVGAQQIVVDKRINNIDKLERIYFEYGNHVWFTAIIRDPRDELLSLLETDRHQEVPRTVAFWRYWLNRYQGVLDFAAEHAPSGCRVGLLRYEDLVTRPETAKRDFLCWLGFEVAPEAVVNHYTNTDPNIAAGVDVTEDWKTHQHNEVHRESFGRWQRVDRPDWRELIVAYQKDAAVREFMLRFGYGDKVAPMTETPAGAILLGADRPASSASRAA